MLPTELQKENPPVKGSCTVLYPYHHSAKLHVLYPDPLEISRGDCHGQLVGNWLTHVLLDWPSDSGGVVT